jgi:hypothetical protein
MYLHVKTFLLILMSSASAQDTPEYRTASVTHKVRAFASLDAPRVGIIYGGDVFEVGPIVGYDNCAAGWAKVGSGVLCLVKTQVVDDSPITLPKFLSVLPPLEEGVDELQFATEQDPPFMPVLFAKRDQNHEGRLWGSIEELEAGVSHRWKLKTDKDYRFVAAHQTTKGWALERPNGSVTLISEVYLYPVSRFSGRDFRVFPKDADSHMGWVNDPHGATVYWSPDDEQPSGLTMERRRILEIHPLSDNEGWVEIPMGDVSGYLKQDQLTLWHSITVPENIEADEVWIDADLSSQMFSVFEGEQLIFTTLMSTAKKGHKTPLGTYQIYDKAVGWDLGSREGAEDAYYMEDVPFVMHYYPRYAIHSAFWHDNFGETASHGCINLAPKDAWTVYQMVSPTMPKGWQYIKQHKEDPGTLVRIRNGKVEGSRKRIRPKY